MPTAPRYSKIADCIVQRIKPPCIGCEKRNPGCHGRCEGYQDYKMQVEAEKKKLYEACINETKVEDYEIKRRVKNHKRK